MYISVSRGFATVSTEAVAPAARQRDPQETGEDGLLEKIKHLSGTHRGMVSATIPGTARANPLVTGVLTMTWR